MLHDRLFYFFFFHFPLFLHILCFYLFIFLKCINSIRNIRKKKDSRKPDLILREFCCISLILHKRNIYEIFQR